MHVHVIVLCSCYVEAQWSLFGKQLFLLVYNAFLMHLAYLTDHLITGKPFKFEPAQEKGFSKTVHTYKQYWFDWVVIFNEAHLECHDILMLGKSPIKCWQRPDMTIAVD